jgi:hypothetical protein
MTRPKSVEITCAIDPDSSVWIFQGPEGRTTLLAVDRDSDQRVSIVLSPGDRAQLAALLSPSSPVARKA